MKILDKLPKDYTYDLPLEELDNENLNAKIMIDVFKELSYRLERNPGKCPWCKH